MSLVTDLDNNESEFKKISEVELLKITEKANKVGYADGVAAGEENAFQSGFDEGYKIGLNRSLQLAKYQSFFEHMDNTIENEDLLKEKAIYNDLKITEIQINDEDVDKIIEQEKTYLSSCLQKYTEKLPITTALLEIKI